MDADSILIDFEKKIHKAIEFYLVVNTDRTFWEQNNKFRYRNAREVYELLIEEFDPMYTEFPELEEGLDESLELLRQCIWVGMNVPWPVDPDDHIERVVANVMTVYDTVVYGKLRFLLPVHA